jgi:predicted ester cyclase
MGPFPPSGKPLEIPFLGILRIEDGKIAEIWVEWDNLSALTKLGHLPPPGAATESRAANKTAAQKALARRWFDDIINERNLDAIDEIYAADYVHHGAEGAEIHGRDEARTFAAAILAASTDRRAEVEQQVVEGDLVVTRFTSSGTHTGPFMGHQPTGEPWTTEGIVISRIENGQIAEDWEIVHVSGLQ